MAASSSGSGSPEDRPHTAEPKRDSQARAQAMGRRGHPVKRLRSQESQYAPQAILPAVIAGRCHEAHLRHPILFTRTAS